MSDSIFHPSRRLFLTLSAAAAGSFAVPSIFREFLARTARAGENEPRKQGHEKLVPTKDESTGLELLKLPEGFRYLSFGWSGDKMDDGRKTPDDHDGMSVVADDNGILTLVRNHENRSQGKAIGPADLTYDPHVKGGCATLKFDSRQGKWLSSRISLSGTSNNCAGGPTPWGSWLSCEEIVAAPNEIWSDKLYDEYEKDHGWIFEVPAEGKTTAQPMKGMGRFVHEAIAVDPKTGIVYETEDRSSAGCYRYIPKVPGQLAEGGKLEMLKVDGHSDLRKGMTVGEALPVTWVPIPEPERGHYDNDKKDGQGVYRQGKAQGASTFARLEGAWYGNRSVFLVSTSGGNASLGQIWQYDIDQQELKLIYESPARHILDMPDNITVSPRGSLVLCEDGDLAPQCLHGLKLDGTLFTLAANNLQFQGEHKGFKGLKKDYRGEEWCGASFSPDGQWLFANIQNPGVTFAITGPWQDLGL